MNKEELEPDLDTLKRLLPEFRKMRDWFGGAHFSGGGTSTADIVSDRVNLELTLLRYKTQERHIKVLEKSIRSQDKLAYSQIFLGIVGIIVAIVLALAGLG